MPGKASLLKRFDELIELGKTLLPFQNDLKYLAKKQAWMASCQLNIEKAFGKESSYHTAFQNLARLGNQEAHITHGLALMESVREELEKATAEKTDASQVPPAGSKANTNEVFIVHGRDHKPVEELKGILVEFGLNPVVLQEKAGGSLTIIEKLEKYSKKVGFAFVILTPDDIGAFAQDILPKLDKAITEIDSSYKKQLSFNESPKAEVPLGVLMDMNFIKGAFEWRRARQNVILEFGLLIGLLGRTRVSCLYKQGVELPSDMYGMHYVLFNDSVNEVKEKIATELREAEYKIKTDK